LEVQISANLDHVVVLEILRSPRLRICPRTPVEDAQKLASLSPRTVRRPVLSNASYPRVSNFRGKTLGGVLEVSERWKRGVEHRQRRPWERPIGRNYAARYFPGRSQGKGRGIGRRQLRLALKGRIERVAWMIARETKIKRWKSSRRLNVKIGRWNPAKWRDSLTLEIRPDDLVGDLQAAGRFGWLRKVRSLNSPCRPG